jgi:hypothetical protein
MSEEERKKKNREKAENAHFSVSAELHNLGTKSSQYLVWIVST